MKLVNNSKNAFIHVKGEVTHKLPIGATVEVPEDVAKVWLKYDGISEVKEKKAEEVKSKTTKKTSK